MYTMPSKTIKIPCPGRGSHEEIDIDFWPSGATPGVVITDYDNDVVELPESTIDTVIAALMEFREIMAGHGRPQDA